MKRHADEEDPLGSPLIWLLAPPLAVTMVCCWWHGVAARRARGLERGQVGRHFGCKLLEDLYVTTQHQLVLQSLEVHPLPTSKQALRS